MNARKIGFGFANCASLFVGSAMAAPQAADRTYQPPSEVAALLAKVDFAGAKNLSEDYRLEFARCDGQAQGGLGKDHFRGVDLHRPGKPDSQQYYLCSRDPSNVKALLKLPDGGIYWHSKMALDVDGSWAAWSGLPGATDQKETSYKWPKVRPSSSQAAQIDPDRIPFIVMPLDGVRALTGAASQQLGSEFGRRTGLSLGDMGVVIYGSRWTPVLIGDGGPFMRLGEGSSRVFEAIGQSRCKRWDGSGQRCVGTGGYPYRNFGLGHDVIFVVYPGSRDGSITAANAVAKLCAFARVKLNLTGGATCPN